MVVFLEDLLGAVAVMDVCLLGPCYKKRPISTIAIFLTTFGYFSSAWNAAIITLLNTQNPHDDAVVSKPSVPA